MAKPRVFISSTFYDLRQVREDLATFVRDLGYEPVLFERGNVAYGRSEALENYCYKEIGISDVLVAVIGGRYGSQSKENGYSITQNEIKHALDEGKQVYLFVDKNVYAEYYTYLLNKDTMGMKYRHADDIKVYQFLEEVLALPVNNATFSFESSSEVVTILKEQWAGLFQRLLQDESKRSQTNLLQTLQSTVTTLQQALEFLNDKKPLPDSVLMLEHPAFSQVSTLLHIPFRVVFLNIDELHRLLREQGYLPIRGIRSGSAHLTWISKAMYNERVLLRVSQEIFDETGKLRMTDPKNWNSGWISIETIVRPKQSPSSLEEGSASVEPSVLLRESESPIALPQPCPRCGQNGMGIGSISNQCTLCGFISDSHD